MPQPRAGRARLYRACLMLAATFSSPQTLLAACSDNTPRDNAAVTCSGSDSIGVQSPTSSNVTVTINSGARIATSGGPAIELGAGAEVVNYGSITASAPFSVSLSAGSDRLLNRGSIGGSVDLGDGDNIIELSGGSIAGSLLAGSGADRLHWRAGTVAGDILLGSGDDEAVLEGVANPGDTLIHGGAGRDRLRLVGQLLQDPSRLQGWESVVLGDDSLLIMNSSMTLGGSEPLATHLRIAADSALFAPEFSTAITPAAEQPLLVENHGVIDLRGGTANYLRIAGDYSGTGTLYLELLLNGDDSAADRLVIDGGRASGSTEIRFERLRGSGETSPEGILLVEAINGGSTDAGAFQLREPLSAGPYEYQLFRGGDSSEEADNWYLRAHLLPPVAELQADGADTTGAATGRQARKPIPLYRPEIPLYAQAKSLAQQLSLQQISSFQQRRGEQRNWSNGHNSGWLRLYHQDMQLDWQGDVYSRFDGTMSGLQLSGNLYAGPTCHGSQELGLFAGSSIARGDVTGFARGLRDYRAGTNDIDSYYAGIYFSDYRHDQSYLDLLFKVGYVGLESTSFRGLSTRIRGPQLSLSIEKGIALPLGERFNLEPQLQTLVNYTNMTAYEDGISRVEVDMTPEVTFRAGLRGYNTQGDNQYYLFANLWYTLGGYDGLLFDNRITLKNQRRATWAEVGAGTVLLEFSAGSIFFNLSYQHSLDRLDWQGGSGNLGFNLNW